MTASIAILLLACLINILLGLFVFFRNTKTKGNKVFLLVSLSVTCWMVTSYLTDNGSTVQINALGNRLAYFFGFIVILSFLWFTFYFPEARKIQKKWRMVLLAVALLVGPLSLTSFVAGSVEGSDGAPEFIAGPLIIFYTLVLLAMLGTIIRNLSVTMRHGTAVQRIQARVMLIGFSVSAFLAILTNLIIPTISSDWQSTKVGPMVSIILVGSISYAIVKHRLFDVRSFVARAVAYLISAMVVAGISLLVITILFARLFESQFFAGTQGEILLVFSGIIISFAFNPARRLFNRLTNKLFYRDAYDPEILLDEINTTLVSNIDIDKLLNDTADIIARHIKADSVLFAVGETEKTERKIIGTVQKGFDEKDIAFVRSATPGWPGKIIITDELEEDNEHLRRVLLKNGVAVIVRLVNHGDSIGYLILGYKKSGNVYNSQDRRVLDIISDEVTLAIINALRYEEIQQFSEKLQREIGDATKQLRHSNEKLKALDETKDDFISMASHQLRTPLTSVKGYVSMVLDGDAGPINDQQRKLLEQSFISSQRMVYLISDLLNLSRLRTGKFVIEPANVYLPDVVDQEMSQLQETAAARGLTMSFDKPEDFPHLALDDTKIRQVVMNFLDNAIYYTPSGGHIKLELEADKHSAEFRIVDNGLGVPKAEQHHLFTKFYRAKNAKKARPDGTGLGLFMARKVIVAQGGSIVFKSREGKGSTFGFNFPRHKLEIAPDAKLAGVNGVSAPAQPVVSSVVAIQPAGKEPVAAVKA